MPTVKCDNCGHSVEVEDSTKKYRLLLYFVLSGAYGNNVSNPSIIITILGGQSAIAGLILLVVRRLGSNRN